MGEGIGTLDPNLGKRDITLVSTVGCIPQKSIRVRAVPRFREGLRCGAIMHSGGLPRNLANRGGGRKL
jgi:hypothetical protein